MSDITDWPVAVVEELHRRFADVMTREPEVSPASILTAIDRGLRASVPDTRRTEDIEAALEASGLSYEQPVDQDAARLVKALADRRLEIVRGRPRLVKEA